MLRCSSIATRHCLIGSSASFYHLRSGFQQLDRLSCRVTGHGSVRAIALRASADQTHHTAADSYQTLAAPHRNTLEVKKSKFIATAWRAASAEEAMRLVAAETDPSASHNCFAYLIGDERRSSDDGEPGGTAGSPILNAIAGEGLDNVCVLVTRHFGGTKLGAGGLIRAYGQAARDCLRAAETCDVVPQSRLRLELLIGDIGIAYGMLEKLGGERLGETYSTDGQTVELAASVQRLRAAELESALLDATSGRSTVHHDL